MDLSRTHRVPYREAMGDHSYADVATRLDRCVLAVSKRVRVPANSRVARWREALARLSSANKRSVLEQMIASLRIGRWDHAFHTSFRALVDSRMFIEIVEQLLCDLSDRDLHDLISGHYNPGEDSRSSRSRDREYELFIGAMCRRSGLHVRLEEPDIVFDLDKQPVCIAAKRVRSPRKVDNNVADAAEQIRRAQRPGFVFLDVSMLLDPSGTAATHWRTVDQVVGGRLLTFAERRHATTLRRARNVYLRGTVLRVAFPHVSPGPSYGTFENWWAVAIDGVPDRPLVLMMDQLVLGGQGT